MAGAEAEETGKAERANSRIDAFQRATKDFRAHVDAEGSLQYRPQLANLDRRGCGERGSELPLCCPLGSNLQQPVDDGIEGRADQRIERFFEDKPDGKQLKRRGVRPSLDLGLELDVSRILRPAADGQQQLVEVGAGFGTEAQRHRRPLYRSLRRLGCLVDMDAEALQPQDFRRQVMGRKGTPGGVEPVAPGRGPEGLTLIEETGCKGSDPVRDQPGPILARGPRGKIRDRRQCDHRLRFFADSGLQRRKIDAVEQRARLEGSDQVLIGDLSVGDLVGIVLARQSEPDATDPGKPGCGMVQRFTDLAEEGVDGNGRRQRPGRRDRPHRIIGRPGKRFAMQCIDCGHPGQRFTLSRKRALRRWCAEASSHQAGDRRGH